MSFIGRPRHLAKEAIGRISQAFSRLTFSANRSRFYLAAECSGVADCTNNPLNFLPRRDAAGQGIPRWSIGLELPRPAPPHAHRGDSRSTRSAAALINWLDRTPPPLAVEYRIIL